MRKQENQLNRTKKNKLNTTLYEMREKLKHETRNGTESKTGRKKTKLEKILKKKLNA